MVGICGGYQMLGRRVLDPLGLESKIKEITGLGLLEMETELLADKVTAQVTARVLWSGLTDPHEPVHGYEIHMGRSRSFDPTKPLLEIVERNGEPVKVQDGLVSEDGRVWGCYLHSIFDNDKLRHRLIDPLMSKSGNSASQTKRQSFRDWREEQYDKLADHFRAHLDMKRIYRIIGL